MAALIFGLHCSWSRGFGRPSPTIFIDHTTVNKGFWALIGTAIAYAPVLIYIIIKSRKNREITCKY